MANPPQIVTVTLNAALDQTAQVENFRAGRVNRVKSDHSDAGGKGVNVAGFLAQYGYSVAATGLLGRGNLEPFETLFAEKGISDRFVKVPGSTRVNVKLVDRQQELVTDINFPGVRARSESIAEVMETVLALADDGAGMFILSGSLPQGVQTDIYRQMIDQLKARGRKVMLDTSGIPFDRALQAQPHVIKPNIDELKEVVGSALDTEADIIAAARDLAGGGIELAVVSMRDRGALFITRDTAVLAVPPKARIVSTVGAGDGMVAGIAHGLLTGMTLPEMARLATAFSLGALGQLGPNLPPREDIDAFAELVDVSELPKG